MWPSSPVYERVPVLWILVGLLFNATGLYLGFEYSLSFLYILIGCFCFVFGVALMAFRWREQPKSALEKRLSPNFVSATDTQIMHAMSAESHANASGNETERAPGEPAASAS